MGEGTKRTLAAWLLLVCSLLLWPATVTSQGTAELPRQVLFPSQAQTNAEFGLSLAASGERLLVGSPGLAQQGGAFVFSRGSLSMWSEEGMLLAADTDAGDGFGESVALRGDWALVGAPQAAGNTAFCGATYFYVRQPNGQWQEMQKLIAVDGCCSDQFGYRVAFHPTSDVAFIAARLRTLPGMGVPAQGTVYVFTYRNGLWSEVAQILAPPASGSTNLGIDLAVTDTHVFVSALGASPVVGRLFIFVPVSFPTVWSVEQALEEAPIQGFGRPVLPHDTSLFVGAVGNDSAAPNGGAVYTYEYDGATWNPTGLITASDAVANDRLGTALAARDGTLLVGAAKAQEGGVDGGKVYVFQRNGNTWIEDRVLLNSSVESCDGHGARCAFVGPVPVVSALFDNDGSLSAGSLSIYQALPITSFVRADCNADGMVNVADVIFDLANLFDGGREPTCGDSCDVNDDGVRNIADAVFALAYLFSLGPVPSDPGLSCGPDPTQSTRVSCHAHSACP